MKRWSEQFPSALRESAPRLFAVTVIALCAFLAGRAWAGGVPASGALSYSGRLEDASGAVLVGEHALQINFWNAAQPGMDPLCQTQSKLYELTAGRFSINLPDVCADAIKNNADVWSELLVDGVSLGTAKLGAVPFALEAGHATSADQASGELKATIDELRTRVSRVIRVPDKRSGCPPAAAPQTDLIKLDFTLSKSASVHISGDMIRRFNGRTDLVLFIDGVRQYIGVTYSTTLEWVPAHVEWAGTLPEGAHTASVRSSNTAPTADIWGCGALHGGMTALIFE